MECPEFRKRDHWSTLGSGSHLPILPPAVKAESMPEGKAPSLLDCRSRRRPGLGLIDREVRGRPYQKTALSNNRHLSDQEAWSIEARPHQRGCASRDAVWDREDSWHSWQFFAGIGQFALCPFSDVTCRRRWIFTPAVFFYSKSFVRNKEILWPKKALSEKVLLGFLSYFVQGSVALSAFFQEVLAICWPIFRGYVSFRGEYIHLSFLAFWVTWKKNMYIKRIGQ